MRAFLAVPVRPPAHREVAELVERLSALVPGVRWVDTATVHVTLHFFADLPAERLAAVTEAVGRATAGQPAIPLRLEAPGSFGAGAHTRVLWLGVAESPALLELAVGVRGAVAECGFDLEGRPFHPHVTLGRPGRHFDPTAWRAAAAAPTALPAFVADRVVLYESRDGHHVRATFPLETGALPEGSAPRPRRGEPPWRAPPPVRDHPPVPALDAPPRWLSLEALRRRRSYKWRAHPADVLPAFIAEMDVTLAPAVTAVLSEAIAAGDTGYAHPDPELGAGVAAFHHERFGWELDPAAVSVLPDVMTGVGEVLRRALTPGSGVVVNTPVYPPFFGHVAEVGCRIVEAPLARAGDGYVMDLEALEAAFRGGASAYLLCSPHNPAGLVPSASELRGVAGLAERYGVLVLADEIHAPLTLAGARHVPYLSLEEARPHAIAFVSASKGWNLPGLKCAQMVTASAAMGALVGRLPEGLPFAASNLGVIASIAAYRDGVAWLDGLLALLEVNRGLLARLLAERLPGVRHSPPRATYLAWLDCGALDLPGDPAQVFLERGRVALRPGPEFGSGGNGFVRVTAATGPEILTEIVERMRAALDG